MADQPSALSVRPQAPRRRQHTAHNLSPSQPRRDRGPAGLVGPDQQPDGDACREVADAGTRLPGTESTSESELKAPVLCLTLATARLPPNPAICIWKPTTTFSPLHKRAMSLMQDAHAWSVVTDAPTLHSPSMNRENVGILEFISVPR